MKEKERVIEKERLRKRETESQREREEKNTNVFFNTYVFECVRVCVCARARVPTSSVQNAHTDGLYERQFRPAGVVVGDELDVEDAQGERAVPAPRTRCSSRTPAPATELQ